MSSVAVGILVFVFVLFALLFVYASRVRKVGPNEVLVISGRGNRDAGTNYRIVTGGRSFIWPVLERVDNLSLELMTIEVRTNDVPTVHGVPVTIDSVSQIKIGSDDNAIRTASIQFLSKTQGEIEHVAHETLAGHLRAMAGTLTVEQLYRDREAFAQQVQSVSGDDMASMGMEIVSFVIKDINDDEGYLEALGRPRIAEVKRDAIIGEAEAERDATIRSAEARREGEAAKFENETQIAESRKNFEVEQAAYQADINRQKAEAELAYTLQENITNQEVTSAAVAVQIVEKQRQIEVEEEEVKRRERELDATVRKPAEAERYRVETIAEARAKQLEREAEGQAAATKAKGFADADVTHKLGVADAEAAKAKGLAEAEIIRQQGLAQAEVIKQQGLAEAEATRQKAEAWKEYTQAAIIQQLIDVMPQIADAIAQPLAKTDKIVIVNSGGDGGAGASKITQDITNMVAQVPATLEALTGVDVTQALQNLAGVKEMPDQSTANGTVIEDIEVTDGDTSK